MLSFVTIFYHFFIYRNKNNVIIWLFISIYRNIIFTPRKIHFRVKMLSKMVTNFTPNKMSLKSYGNTFFLIIFDIESILVTTNKKIGFFIKVFSYFKNGQNKMSKFHFSKYFLEKFCY